MVTNAPPEIGCTIDQEEHTASGSRMAKFRDGTWVKFEAGAKFDSTYAPGVAALDSGIYRCDVCGVEVIGIAGYPLPHEYHHAHPEQQSSIRWRLLVQVE